MCCFQEFDFFWPRNAFHTMIQRQRNIFLLTKICVILEKLLFFIRFLSLIFSLIGKQFLYLDWFSLYRENVNWYFPVLGIIPMRNPYILIWIYKISTITKLFILPKIVGLWNDKWYFFRHEYPATIESKYVREKLREINWPTIK